MCALEGMIQNIPWKDLAAEDKAQLKQNIIVKPRALSKLLEAFLDDKIHPPGYANTNTIYRKEWKLCGRIFIKISRVPNFSNNFSIWIPLDRKCVFGWSARPAVRFCCA